MYIEIFNISDNVEFCSIYTVFEVFDTSYLLCFEGTKEHKLKSPIQNKIRRFSSPVKLKVCLYLYVFWFLCILIYIYILANSTSKY